MQIGWEVGMVSLAEARLCSLLVTNITEFGQFRVDTETLMDIKYGFGAYGSISYEETIKLICEDYNWEYKIMEKIDLLTKEKYCYFEIYGKR